MQEKNEQGLRQARTSPNQTPSPFMTEDPQAFDMFDLDGSGSLDEKEIAILLRRLDLVRESLKTLLRSITSLIATE